MLNAEQFGQLDQRDVHLGLDRSQDHVPISLDVTRTQVATLRQGRHPPFGAPGTDPTDGTRNGDAETLGGSVAR
jgi:hypothetical protein